MSSKRGRPVDANKDQVILGAARELVFAKGPRALTMDAVAKRAGVSKTTLYVRYTDRLTLLQAVIDSDIFAINDALNLRPVSMDELRGHLIGFLEALIVYICSEHHQRVMQALSELPQTPEDMAEIYRNGPKKTQELVSRYLDAAAHQGLIDCPDPAASAELLLGMAVGLDLIRVQYGVPLERRNAAIRTRHAQAVVGAFLILHRVKTR